MIEFIVGLWFTLSVIAIILGTCIALGNCKRPGMIAIGSAMPGVALYILCVITKVQGYYSIADVISSLVGVK